MNEHCGCCEGTEQITPVTIANRPGLSALIYRVGTHAAFLETMKARLSNLYLEIQKEAPGLDGRPEFERIYPLRGLTTRAEDDPTIALLDAWAVVGDVLTFYQERIANEGYLRTATERRSILELARLVGYALRPGVAATVYLAYTLDGNFKDEVVIPAGARVQSVPGPDERPQPFETSDPLVARAAWNVLRPRMSRPQTRRSIEGGGDPRLYLKGTSTNLRPNDPLLIDFGAGAGPELVRVREVQADAAADRTLVTLQAKPAAKRVSDTPEVIASRTRRALDAIIARYQAPERERIGLAVESTAFSAASAHLETLRPSLRPEVPFPALLARLSDETLPMLEAELGAAEAAGDEPAQAWLRGVLGELRAAAAAAAELRAEALAREFTLADGAGGPQAAAAPEQLSPLIGGLAKAPSVPPASALQLRRSLAAAFQPKADAGLQVVGAFKESLRATLPAAVANAKAAPDVKIKVYALRVRASLFGSNLPGDPVYSRDEDGTVSIVRYNEPDLNATFGDLIEGLVPLETIALDSAYDQIVAPGWAAIERPVLGPNNQVAGRTTTIHAVSDVYTSPRTALGVTSKSTHLTLDPAWLAELGQGPIRNILSSTAMLRGTVVYAQSEELALAEEPIADAICGSDDAAAPGAFIELDGVYPELQAGRWLIVSGERDDVRVPDPDDPSRTVAVPGVRSSELVMLAEVVQRVAEPEQLGKTKGAYGYGPPPLPGERVHTWIRLASELEYCYRRDAVTIYGNVVKATHGETRSEVLGSGDGSKALQAFTLKQPPLTFVAAPNPRGVDSTLVVRVNDVEWHEADSLAGLGPTDRRFITRTGDDDKTTVVFGNGRRGARLPTGAENVRAVYRSGIGRPGNVKAEQISLLVTRPLGVKAVINPLRASGGADRESRDMARKNAPLAVLALDRLVSTRDYEDFARVFAGIGKASAARLSDGRRRLVHLTIAGADDIPIDKTSDLYRNLVTSLRQYGDPDQPVQVDLRELLLVVLSAHVRLHPDYLWDAVAPKIRARLLDAFSFERRELAQDVALSEVISVIQAVEGVVYVDVDTLRGIPETTADASAPGGRRLLTPDEISATIAAPLLDAHGSPVKEPLQRLVAEPAVIEGRNIRPAQLAFLTPEVPATLILNQIT